ncbi:hypothetical protein GBA52_018459 [Prunus armeniaca]|nr:hypothetical protein GBA52_018459 [Prunus armeniaca]
MGRAPCCEKMGLKKGPWTPEEDETLISYIRQHGHSNWRALPKQAGVERVADFDGLTTCGQTLKGETLARKKKKPSSSCINFLEIGEYTTHHHLLLTASLFIRYIYIYIYISFEQESQVPAAAPLTRSINNIIPLKNGDRRIQCPIQYAPTTFFRLDDDLHNKLLSKRTCSSPNIINADPGLQPPFSSSSNSTAGQIMKREGSKTHEDMDFWYSLFMKAGEPSTVALPVCHCMMEFSAI